VWRGCHGDSSLGIPGEKKKKKKSIKMLSVLARLILQVGY